MQPRAKIFLETHDEWDNIEYMIWIGRKAKEYKEKHNIMSITDHEDFTNFLRESD